MAERRRSGADALSTSSLADLSRLLKPRLWLMEVVVVYELRKVRLVLVLFLRQAVALVCASESFEALAVRPLAVAASRQRFRRARVAHVSSCELAGQSCVSRR